MFHCNCIKVEHVVRELEQTGEIASELGCNATAPCKKGRYLPEKSIEQCKKNPTSLDALSSSVGRKRRSELFEAACQINGGQNENNSREPAEVGLCETTVKRCTEKTMIKVFSRSKKVT